MISEAYFQNLLTLRMSAKNRDLGVVSSQIVETGQAVALVVAIRFDGAEYVVTPFGMLDAAPGETHVDEDGHLTSQARERFESLSTALRDDAQQAWLVEQADRVRVSFAEKGVDASKSAAPTAVTLAWGNPYELFAEPAVAA